MHRATNSVKSKQRVADHGEVFTPEWMVEAMLDLVKDETDRIDSRFLEPACGSGNFLVQILRRKLAAVELKYSKSNFEKRHYALGEQEGARRWAGRLRPIALALATPRDTLIAAGTPSDAVLQVEGLVIAASVLASVEQTAQAHATLEEAERITHTLPENEEKERALTTLLEGQIRLGRSAALQDALHQWMSDRAIINALPRIATRMVEEGLHAALEQLVARVRAIQSPLSRTGAFGKLVPVLVAAGRSDDALALRETISAAYLPKNRDLLFQLLHSGTVLYAGRGDQSTLLALVDAILEVDAWWPNAKLDSL